MIYRIDDKRKVVTVVDVTTAVMSTGRSPESQKTTKPLLAQSSSGFISGTGVG
ncbi:hypothetical protein ACIO52_11775 [Nocardia sp. NPDC087230]|uniref:hypothetical protein n=1 Tax=Nocardia sp. NPDC087230 TaxID=3364331 RepID=UPI003824A496